MRTRIERLWPLLALALVAAILLLSFPYLASAYYLEAGGRALDDPERAGQLLNRAISWDQENAQAYRMLARVYQEQGDWESALKMLGRYTALRGDNPLAHAELASLYEAIQRVGASAGIDELQTRIADEWRQAGMTADNLVQAGEVARQAQQYDVAIQSCRRAIELEPEAGDAWYCLGLVYEGQKQWEQALEAYAQAEAKPLLKRVKRSYSPYRMGLIYHQQLDPPDLDRALSSFERALSLDDFDSDLDAAHCHYLVGYVLRQQKAEPDLYMASFERALALNPDHVWAHVLLGMGFYQRDRDVTRAESEILRALEIDPGFKWAYYYLGNMYSGEELWDKASAMYEEALAIDPNFDAAASRLRVVQEKQD